MIYLLEDDNSIRELVVYTLNSVGIEAEGFSAPSAFWAALREKPLPSLFLLDIMLPEEDGIQILGKLRHQSATERIPVIMLTAKGSEFDKVLALDNGADDYVTKPFGMMELVARVRAMLRRTQNDTENEVFSAGALSVNTQKHEVMVAGENVALTLKEFELLCYLMKHKQIVLSRDKLLNKIWGYSFDGESRTVDVHVRSLRMKLGDYGEMIDTVRGVGYRFIGE